VSVVRTRSLLLARKTFAPRGNGAGELVVAGANGSKIQGFRGFNVAVLHAPLAALLPEGTESPAARLKGINVTKVA